MDGLQSIINHNCAIELKNVVFSIRGFMIIDHASIAIHSNELISVFGPNGGGKTTLLRLIMGFLSPDKGSISVFDQPPEQIRHRIGYVPQVHRIDPEFPITVAELVAMGLSFRRSLLSRLSKKDWALCDQWMEQLELLPHKRKAYGELSGGLAQRALLARALIADPNLLILDEPTAHIDAASTSIFWNTINAIRTRTTILIVTHDLNTAIQHSTRLIYVNRKISLFLPFEICDHYHLGLYHPRLERQVGVSQTLTSPVP
jgi:zinc transport system ATP-binding protein